MKRERIVVITGATSGVGRAVALGAANGDLTMVLIGRDRKRADSLIESINRRAPGCDAQFIASDLSRIESVRSLAEEIVSRYERVDLLSYNAGVISLRRRVTEEANELTFAVNYLGFYTLSQLLLPAMGSGSRIVAVAGGPGMIERARLDFDDLQNSKNYFAPRAAIRAALAKTLYVRELNSRLSERSISAAVYHPGLVRSGLGRALPRVVRPFYSIANAFLPAKCPTGTYLVAAPSIPDAWFFANEKPHSLVPRNHDRSDDSKLVSLTAEISGVEAAP